MHSLSGICCPFGLFHPFWSGLELFVAALQTPQNPSKTMKHAKWTNIETRHDGYISSILLKIVTLYFIARFYPSLFKLHTGEPF